MKIKTKILQCTDGTYRIKTSYVDKKRRKIIKFYSAEDLGVSNSELPSIDFRSKILERIVL